ncbi:hypothetical protein FQN54_002261 [Arachnomyces sp. PD_36]|nr:hypothetical protein FQN54_002261 [Arachnomyces sp. PD_36]
MMMDTSLEARVYQSGSISKNNFYDMCGVLLQFPNNNPPWSIFNLSDDGSNGAVVPINGTRLAEGQYVVLSSVGGTIDVTLTGRNHKRRVISGSDSSYSPSSIQGYFRDQLRQRDGTCAMTGKIGEAGTFQDLHAAHIFPRAREPEWNASGYSNWITDSSPPNRIGDNKLDSPQNGLLLFSGVHSLLDTYALADNYKIIAFRNVIDNPVFPFLQTHLGNRTTNAANNQSVSDQAVRWHFEEAVIANMKGAAGVQPWEFDFGGPDDVGGIMEGPDPGERMEAELFTRLGAGDEGVT